MQVKLKACYINATKKDGSPLITRNGKPYHSVTIVSESGNKAYMNIWEDQQHLLPIVSTWKPGSVVDVEIERGERSNSFTLATVTAPQVSGVTREEFKALQDRVHWLETAMKVGKTAEQVAEQYGGEVQEEFPPVPPMPPHPTAEPIKAEDIPW